jgi:hypothetical protein
MFTSFPTCQPEKCDLSHVPTKTLKVTGTSEKNRIPSILSISNVQCWSLLVNLSFGDPHWPSWHLLHLHSFELIYIYIYNIYISVPGASKFAPSSSKALAAAVLNSRRRKTASERQYQVIASWPVNSELQPSCVAQNCWPNDTVHINYQIPCFCWIRNLTHDKSEQRAAKQRCDLFAVTLTVTHTQTAHRPFTIFLSTILPPKKLKHNTTLLVLPLSLWGCFTPSGIEDGRSQGLAGRRGEFGSAWNWYINLKLWRWRRCQLGQCGSPKDKLTNIGNR